MLRLVKIFSLLLITQFATTSKILGIFEFPMRSHHILGTALLKALTDKGHEITMLSAYPQQSSFPNYTHIELVGIRNFAEERSTKNLFLQGFSGPWHVVGLRQYFYKVHEYVLNHTSVKRLIASDKKFDAVIQLYLANDAYFGLAHHFKASSIVFSSIGSWDIITELTRSPAPASYISSIFLAYSDVMDFWQRAKNALHCITMQFYTSTIGVYQQDQLLNKYLPRSPPISELRNNVSLVLLNSHFVIERPRAYFPNIVPIGGFHAKPPNELTKDLKEYMDSSSNGVILFSLGSNVKSAELPADKIQAILYTFATLSQNVLWKFESPAMLSGIPSNVKILKWLPQRDILAHPNIRAFITHGGMLSTIEALYNGVPMVGIPVYGDQIAQINEAVNKGIAIKVDFSTLSYDSLKLAIDEIINNPRYRRAVRNLSNIYKDNPVSPLDTAIYWIEYVIKHKGAHHLKSAALGLTWYQLSSIDVVIFLLGLLMLAIFGLCYMSYKMLLLLSNRIKLTNLKQN